MPKQSKARRIRWRVKRCSDGWLPVVLIGEEPMTLRCQPSKKLARDLARARANDIRGVPANG